MIGKEKKTTIRLSILLMLMVAIVALFFPHSDSASATAYGTNTSKGRGLYSQHKAPFFNLKDLDSAYASWGVSPRRKASINLSPAWVNFKYRKEVVVAVLDTGVDHRHVFLKNNIHFLSDEKDKRIKYHGKDFTANAKNPNSPQDSNGHGTHVAGIIKSVNPKVKLVILKYFNPFATGEENTKATIKALKYALKMDNIDILNYSGGGPIASLQELKILRQLEQKGVLVVSAAGNDGHDIDKKASAYFPASYRQRLSNIITVGSHNINSKVSSFSSYGKKNVDLFAPGSNIRSSVPKNYTQRMMGTSQATAFVTGVASLLKSQFPNLTPRQIRSIITDSVRPEPSMENICSSKGRLDAGAAVALAMEKFSPAIDRRKSRTRTRKRKAR